MIYSTKQELEKLKGVTVLNIDFDHLFLPSDFKDYYAVFPTVSEYENETVIPKVQRDSILPPLPHMENLNLYYEIHILSFIHQMQPSYYVDCCFLS